MIQATQIFRRCTTSSARLKRCKHTLNLGKLLLCTNGWYEQLSDSRWKLDIVSTLGMAIQVLCACVPTKSIGCYSLRARENNNNNIRQLQLKWFVDGSESHIQFKLDLTAWDDIGNIMRGNHFTLTTGLLRVVEA
jgi:hypothetical protein